MNTGVAALSGVYRPASAGLWALAWRQLCRDRVALVSLAILLFYLVLMAASGVGLIAADWPREVCVSYAPPGYMCPEAAAPSVGPALEPDAVAASPSEDMGIVDPLAEALAEIRKELAGVSAPSPRLPTRPPAPS